VPCEAPYRRSLGEGCQFCWASKQLALGETSVYHAGLVQAFSVWAIEAIALARPIRKEPQPWLGGGAAWLGKVPLELVAIYGTPIEWSNVVYG